MGILANMLTFSATWSVTGSIRSGTSDDDCSPVMINDDSCQPSVDFHLVSFISPNRCVIPRRRNACLSSVVMYVT